MATGRHTLSFAKNHFYGDNHYTLANGGQRGVQWYPVSFHSFGTAPAAADDNALVTKQVAATAAVTGHAFPTVVAGTVSSLTTFAVAAGSYRVLDTPRNITITTSDLDGGVTFIIKGQDVYGATMWERISATASDAVVSGKKAFKVITAVAFDTAGSSGTFFVGFGDRFGLPHKIADPHFVVQAHSGTNAVATDFSPSDFVLPTYTASETHSATVAVTGFAGLPRDVRGTWKAPDSPDGALLYSISYIVEDPDTKFGTYGLDQAKT